MTIEKYDAGDEMSTQARQESKEKNMDNQDKFDDEVGHGLSEETREKLKSELRRVEQEMSGIKIEDGFKLSMSWTDYSIDLETALPYVSPENMMKETPTIPHSTLGPIDIQDSQRG